MKTQTTIVEVAAPFAYAHDGKTVRQLAAGEEVEVWNDVLAGLESEGLVKRVETRNGAARSKKKATQATEAAEAEPVAADVEGEDAVEG